VTQDSFVEAREGVEFGGGEQVDEMPADVEDVLGAASSMRSFHPELLVRGLV
jgi:hypothetical protein